MAIVALVVSVINAIVRLVRMFGGSKRSRSTTTGGDPTSRNRATTSRSPRQTPSTSKPDLAKPKATPPVDTSVGSDGGIARLFQHRRSDVIVTASGKVVKILPDDDDDTDGSGLHQLFLVDLITGVCVKVSHNLAFGRVPVREGQIVSFKGEYEYTEKGGTVHWTHHDPKGWHEDGWIELDGKRYG